MRCTWGTMTLPLNGPINELPVAMYNFGDMQATIKTVDPEDDVIYSDSKVGRASSGVGSRSTQDPRRPRRCRTLRPGRHLPP
jgi:hypothetical protein